MEAAAVKICFAVYRVIRYWKGCIVGWGIFITSSRREWKRFGWWVVDLHAKLVLTLLWPACWTFVDGLSWQMGIETNRICDIPFTPNHLHIVIKINATWHEVRNFWSDRMKRAIQMVTWIFRVILRGEFFRVETLLTQKCSEILVVFWCWLLATFYILFFIHVGMWHSIGIRKRDGDGGFVILRKMQK